VTFLPTREHVVRFARRTPPGRAVLRVRVARAARHRRSLSRPRFVAVTGSAAKTTTKDLIEAVLSSRLRGVSSPGSSNVIGEAARTILRTSDSDDFAVIEVAAVRPGSVAESAALLRPDVAVVTRVGLDHFKSFRTFEATAAEKRALVEATDGVAVLNADDPLVLEMGQGFSGRVATFGESQGAAFRAEAVAARWPDRLTFTLSYEGRSVPVSTRLCGAPWTTSVLAALAVGTTMGIPLEDAVAAVEIFEPTPGRMSPVFENGVTFIRDDWKAPSWSIDQSLDFVAEARADRKVVVVGTISDYPGSTSRVYRRVAERALDVADEVVFVGPQSQRARRALAPGRPLRLIDTVRDATEYFRASLREGDLVLLKGSVADHLGRIVLARTETVRCWRQRCGRSVFCETCYLRRLPAGP
jgi:UDP-N-acetylmuramoyl-tripeptide--D-alanyl-D-alanine ligase